MDYERYVKKSHHHSIKDEKEDRPNDTTHIDAPQY